MLKAFSVKHFHFIEYVKMIFQCLFHHKMKKKKKTSSSILSYTTNLYTYVLIKKRETKKQKTYIHVHLSIPRYTKN